MGAAMSDRFPIFMHVLHQMRRSLLLWGLALSAVSAMYLGFYPSMGGEALDDLVASLPDDLVVALGYDAIGTAGGWVTSTVYGLLGPILLSVFAVSTGARLIAGEEEAGTMELELTSPQSRLRILGERLVALATAVGALVTVMTIVCWILIRALAMDVPIDRLLAGSAGLGALTLGFGSLAFGVGAATGRRSAAVGVAAALAVLAFMFDALGPVVEQNWMSEISPFFWYLGGDPLIDGFDYRGLAKLAVVPIASALVAAVALPRRDLRT